MGVGVSSSGRTSGRTGEQDDNDQAQNAHMTETAAEHGV